MSNQTGQKKWQELAEILDLELLSSGPKSAIFKVSGKNIHIGYDSQFRDHILDAIFAAKQRTPLELAAEEMAETLQAILADSAFEDLCQAIGKKPKWLKGAEDILKKAGVIE